MQRVAGARVTVEGGTVGAIDGGLLVLVGVERGDGEEQALRLAGRTARLRIFADERGRFDRSVLDVGGGVLAVSQFTLLADTAKGNRPSFTRAADPATPSGSTHATSRLCGPRAWPASRPAASGRPWRSSRQHGPVTILLEAAPASRRSPRSTRYVSEPATRTTSGATTYPS